MLACSKPAAVLLLWTGRMLRGESWKDFEESHGAEANSPQGARFAPASLSFQPPCSHPSSLPLCTSASLWNIPNHIACMVWPDLAATRGQIQALCSGSTESEPPGKSPRIVILCYIYSSQSSVIVLFSFL